MFEYLSAINPGVFERNYNFIMFAYFKFHEKAFRGLLIQSKISRSNDTYIFIHWQIELSKQSIF